MASKPDNTSDILSVFYGQLNKSGGSNDGQVPASHQVLPKSKLLAYFNADHWAIALPFKDKSNGDLAWLTRIAELLADRNYFPRETLLEAVLVKISEDLE